MTYDLSSPPDLTDASVSDTVNKLIDASLQANNAESPKRDYLGASALGNICSRALQYGYTHTSPDQPFSGRTLRIFEMGHAIEGMTLNWLTGAGFNIRTQWVNGKPFGFSAAEGKIQGHADGIIQTAPPETGIVCPAIWECKSMNARSWKQTAEKGLRASKPAYAVQIALYQAYMEETIPGVSLNPALFTAVNKDTSEIYHELVPFDAALAQEASDRGVNILRATEAKESLPRISADPEYFECRFCDWKGQCWKEEKFLEAPKEERQAIAPMYNAKDKIDFQKVQDAARGFEHILIKRILPKAIRQGSEYVSLNPTRNDRNLGSFKINAHTFRWADFATDDKGRDILSLWAYVRQISQHQAAQEIMGILGGA